MPRIKHFMHIKHAYISNGSGGYREIKMPPHPGRMYLDTYLVRMVARNPDIACGYIVYDNEDNALMRKRSLYVVAKSDVYGCYDAAICQRGNVVYVIKAANAHA